MNKIDSQRPSRTDKLMNNLLAKQNKTKLIVEIDRGLHLALKKLSVEQEISMKQLVSEVLNKFIKT